MLMPQSDVEEQMMDREVEKVEPDLRNEGAVMIGLQDCED
jgi:hypothetical protein